MFARSDLDQAQFGAVAVLRNEFCVKTDHGFVRNGIAKFSELRRRLDGVVIHRGKSGVLLGDIDFT